ncbi:cysteine-rich CWC family protein [Nostoc ellipsosporum NOK]|nr:cysteine-rich CWC family protein [Nostoc ellipsosporum NOK]
MSCHEQRKCPRCGNGFECKPGNITECQCFGIALTDEQRSWIEQKYSDCLCRDCLQHLQQQVNLFREKHGL